MDYVTAYSQEVPLKYNQLKAQHIMRGAKAAEHAMLKESKSCDYSSDSTIDSPIAEDLTKKTSSSEKNLKQDAPSVFSKKRSKSTNLHSGKKIRAVATTDDPDFDVMLSDEVTDDDMEEIEEVPDFLDADAPKVDAVLDDIGSLEFDSNWWKMNEIPEKPNTSFQGTTGPTHFLNVGTATPFEYFCLFIHVFSWDRWAKYTNDKAMKELAKGMPMKILVIIEAAFINAWLLYKSSCELALLPLENSLFTF